jgi:hypothetical protein
VTIRDRRPDHRLRIPRPGTLGATALRENWQSSPGVAGIGLRPRPEVTDVLPLQ